MPDRFVLDTSVYIRLIDAPQVVIKPRRLKDAGQVVLLGTHIQQEQLAADPDEQRRGRKLAAPGTVPAVPSGDHAAPSTVDEPVRSQSAREEPGSA